VRFHEGAAGARARVALLDRLADVAVAEGLAGHSLRTLAQAAGSNHSMIAYYFRDRAGVVEAVLGRLAERTGAEPATWEALGDPRMPLATALCDTWSLITRPAALDFVRVCLEAGSGSLLRGSVPPMLHACLPVLDAEFVRRALHRRGLPAGRAASAALELCALWQGLLLGPGATDGGVDEVVRRSIARIAA
jgi:AcrR family transcriptional regulator